MKLGIRSAALAASCCLAFGLAACGGGGDGDEDQVRDITEQLLDNNPDVCAKVTDKFLDRLGGTKAKCEEGAKDEEDKVDAKIDEVEIDGNEATVSLTDDDESELAFVKQDGDWKIDGVTDKSDRASTDTTETETEAETTTDSSTSGKGEVTARAAGDAFLSGVRDADEGVICGLLDEGYAKQLTGAKEFGVAECVNELKGETFSQIQDKLKGVKTRKVLLDSSQDTGSVALSNGKSIAVRWDGSRYVITRLGG